MLRDHHGKHARFFLSALFLLSVVLTASWPAPRAGEKTPPFYPDEKRKGIDSASKPDGGNLPEQLPGVNAGSLQTQEYVVKEGDYLVKILRKKGLVEDHNLPDLLSLLRKLNSSLHNLDMIQPGEKIVILVKVVQDGGSEESPARKLRHERYKVKRGDTLSRLAMQRHPLSSEEFTREYLRLFAESNPSIKDPNRLYVGQVIRLPHYPPEYLESAKTIAVERDMEKSPQRIALSAPTSMESPPPPRLETPPRPKTAPVPASPKRKIPPHAAAKRTAPDRGGTHIRLERDRAATLVITDGLGDVIPKMGEDWIRSGEHFIPMKSGGHINLKADAYPMVRLQKGITVVVDLHDTLPRKMAKILESTWSNYRVVRLSPKDSLRSALDKILKACNYPRVVKSGAPLSLGGDIPVSITGDWIVTLPVTAGKKGPGFVVIHLTDVPGQGLPRSITKYLKEIGVEVIEYPPAGGERLDAEGAPPATRTPKDPAALITALLNLKGQTFASQTNIPAYATRSKDFTFTVHADFYMETGKKRQIIDLRGMSPDVVALLKDNDISVLSLTQEKDPTEMLSRALDFLDVHYDRGPHEFMAKEGDMSRNVKLTVPGIVFHDHKGNSVMATPVNLPSEIVAFLSHRGYTILVLSPFAAPSGSGSV